MAAEPFEVGGVEDTVGEELGAGGEVPGGGGGVDVGGGEVDAEESFDVPVQDERAEGPMVRTTARASGSELGWTAPASSAAAR